jgi:hypothetical protein
MKKEVLSTKSGPYERRSNNEPRSLLLSQELPSHEMVVFMISVDASAKCRKKSSFNFAESIRLVQML